MTRQELQNLSEAGTLMAGTFNVYWGNATAEPDIALRIRGYSVK